MAGAESRPSQGPADLTGLVRSASAGDERAWSELVGEYGPRVFALARSRLRDPDEAEEVTQSVFATIAIKLRGGQYDEHGRFESWLFRIAMNRVRDAVRRARRERGMASRRAAAQQDDVPASEDRSAPSFGALRDAVAALSPADRDIIELRYHAGLSFRQMADLLAEPLGTLLARHHRALRKLQKAIDSDADAHAADGQVTTPAGELQQ